MGGVGGEQKIGWFIKNLKAVGEKGVAKSGGRWMKGLVEG